jgi:hypothetical protein
MHPAARWAFVATSPSAVIGSPPADQLASSQSDSTLQQLVAALSGAFGRSANGR